MNEETGLLGGADGWRKEDRYTWDGRDVIYMNLRLSKTLRSITCSGTNGMVG